MSEGPREVPADMLLLGERRRRLLAHASASDVALGPDVGRVIADEEIETPDDDRLVSDDDRLFDPAIHSPTLLQTWEPGDVILRRPVAAVSLVQVSWDGPVDHETLARAIACHPVDASHARIVAENVEPAPFVASQPGAALEVTLRREDLAVLERLLAAPSPGHALRLVRAACLPDRLTGAQAQAREAVSFVLAAYRRASLAHAWQERVSQRESPQVNRERDEAAIAVLSTLRALLGER